MIYRPYCHSGNVACKNYTRITYFHSNAPKGHDPAVFQLAVSPSMELYVGVQQ
jgi:hypothetical protein